MTEEIEKGVKSNLERAHQRTRDWDSHKSDSNPSRIKGVSVGEARKFYEGHLNKGDEMDEDVDKAGKGPDKPEPKGARGYKITEEPATRSSTHQNYKNYPNRADFGKGEAVTDEDMADLKKGLSSLTQVVKDMTEMLEKSNPKGWKQVTKIPGPKGSKAPVGSGTGPLPSVYSWAEKSKKS